MAEFLRKVYGILAFQLGLTTIVALSFMLNPLLKAFVQSAYVMRSHHVIHICIDVTSQDFHNFLVFIQ